MPALSPLSSSQPAQSSQPLNLDDAIAQVESVILGAVERLLADAFEPTAAAAPQSAELGGTTKAPLTVEGGKIVTPGGFTVFTKGPSEWVIEDPHGHCTHVSGDPHVSVDDVHVFDFKRETSFLLPDGTRIAAKTTPAGNGMTLTSEFTVMTASQKVTVTGVNGATPEIGQVTANQPGALSAYAGDEDVLSYGLENHHAGWNLLRDESGAHASGEVTGDRGGGEGLNGNGHLMAYAPEIGEKGPCADEPGPPTEGGHAGGPTNELPGGNPTPPRKTSAAAHQLPNFAFPQDALLQQQEDRLQELIAFAVRRVIVG